MGELYDREGRGHEIARARDQIEEVIKGVFSVQSQSGPGAYIVTRVDGRWKCTCPDFRGHELPCKHIFAVRERRRRGVADLLPEEPIRPRPTYRQNWYAYNAAHRAESTEFRPVLQDLVSDLEDPNPAKGRGRPRFSYPDLVFCSILRYFEKTTLRKARGDYLAAQRDGFTTSVPSDNLPSLLLRQPETTEILTDLVARSASPLAAIETTFAADSSGFRTTSFGYYCRETHPTRKMNLWKKLHIVAGTQTGIIPAVLVTGHDKHDSPQFPGLIEALVEAGFTIGEVYADKGYQSAKNFAIVGLAGGLPYFAFKKNSRGRAKERNDPSPWYKKMYHLLQADRSDYLKHYHQRSNVEATFGAVKKKLGESLSSKHPLAQHNELLCKVLIHNIQILIQASFERGIPLPGRERSEPELAEIALRRLAPIETSSVKPIASLRWQPGDNN